MHTPRQYQLDAIKQMVRYNTLLADECGLGKTVTGIEAAKRSRTIETLWRALVVCPKRLVYQWEQEIHAQDPTMPITVLQYGIPLSVYQFKLGWFITHYEAAREDISLTNLMWDVVIVDEAHHIKNRNALVTRAVKRIPAARKYSLTGTPIERAPNDLWSILNWMYPDIFRSYWKFYNAYVDEYRDFYGYRHIKGPKNVDKLAKHIRTMFLRRTKEEVEPELPPRTFQTIPIHMYESQQEVYTSIEKSDDLLVKVKDVELYIPNLLALSIRLQQITSYPPILGFDIPSAKIDWVKGWIEDNSTEQIVILTRFRSTADAIADTLGRSTCDKIVGGVQGLPQGFLRGEKQAVVGTIAAMGEGLNLQRANFAAFVDLEYSTVLMNQAFDRIHRMNIDHPKVLYILQCTDTVDISIWRKITKKWTDAEFVYDLVSEWRKRFSSNSH
jgi:SNF2 family DNA or RNA helicase